MTLIHGPLRRVEARPWEQLRHFAAIGRHGSIRKAAAECGVSAPTLMRSLNELEASLDLSLTRRLPEGVQLTRAGERALAIVQSMFAPVYELERLAAEERQARTFVAIAVTQGLGVNWLIPHSRAFMQANPMIGLDFQISNDIADIARYESDLGIQMTPPSDLDVVRIKLGRMHYQLFASAGYLARYGMPRSLEDLRGHRFVEQVDAHVRRGHVADLLGDLRTEQVSARVRGSVGGISAVENGVGIGVLPNYSIAFGNKVVALDIALANHRDIWLILRGETRHSQTVMRVIDWLKSLFDASRYPCFGDAFVDAREIGDMYAALRQ